jgi:hypothetical protein
MADVVGAQNYFRRSRGETNFASDCTSQLLLFHNFTASHSQLITLVSMVSQPAFTVTSTFKRTLLGTLLASVIRRLSNHGSISMLDEIP